MMNIEVTQKGPICVMKFSDRIVLGQPTEVLQKVFKERIKAGDRRFVFDMSKVPFMDSSGLGQTVACHLRASREGGVIRLILSKRLTDLFVLTKLYEIFKIYPGLDEALEGFAEAPLGKPSQEGVSTSQE